MTPWRTVAIVTWRELLDRLRNRTFTWGTIVIVALVAVGVVVPTLIGGDGQRTWHVGVDDGAPEGLGGALQAQLPDDEVELVDVGGEAAASGAVRDGDLDAALVDGSRLLVDGFAPPELLRAVDATLRQLALADRLREAGVADDAVAEVLAPEPGVEVVDTGGEADGTPAGGIVAFAATILLFIAVQFNGNSLLTGAIEEKSSRVVEVLLGVVRPWQLLSAKLIALTALSVAQVLAVAGSALGANALVGAFEVPPATTATVLVSLLMLVVGFTFYASLYTVAGAMASSVEDAQGTSGPLAFVLVGIYMAVIFAVIPAPDGTLAQVLTYLPPTAPFTVPARVAMSAMPGWQIALATLATAAGTLATLRVAARLYGAAVLGGGKLTWRGAWSAETVR